MVEIIECEAGEDCNVWPRLSAENTHAHFVRKND